MLILNKSAVAASLSHADCVDILADTMKIVSRRDVIMPLRQYMKIPGAQGEETGGKFTMMPGYMGSYMSNPRCFGVKLVSKYPPVNGSSSHIGAVILYDADNGQPVAMMDAGELTAIRTSAASALATRELAREDASVLTLMGCGDEARHHIKAILAVRPLTEVIVWGRSSERAATFVERCIQERFLPDGLTIGVEADAETAVRKADILCTVTASTQPILQGSWLEPGTHVNLVGAAVRTSAEADTETVLRSNFYIDYRESAMDQAGELLNAIDAGLVTENHITGEIGELLMGQCPGRANYDEITLYKSLGVAAQDLAAGNQIFENAQRDTLGVDVDW